MTTLKELNEELKQLTDDGDKTRKKAEIAALVAKADNDIRLAQRNIGYNVREWTVEVIVQKYGENLDIDANELFIPDYQRDYKWDVKTASRFIESILLDFPIPYLYIADVFNEDPELDGRVEIIDGSQRIRAIHYFWNNEFELKDLKELKSLEGFKFSDLLASRQRRFLRASLRFIELKGDVEEQHRRDLFERINSGVKRLEAMEVRHGSDAAASIFYRDVISPCSVNPLFSQLAPLSDRKRSNGDHRELVLRFFAYLNDLDNYKGFVAPFIDQYMNTQANQVTQQNVSSYTDEFEKMLQFVNAHFPMGFKKTPTSKTTPRARYEAIAVGTALALRSNPQLLEPAQPISDWLFEAEFEGIVTADSANNTTQLKNRIFYVRDKLLGV
ncbi:DUF262 domain-containing protein [Klebsiella pneumoniae]|jgi:hypothetical protein|uniref:Uncharacterized conserved protein n=1 Tax=Klebsiella pneumoniae TaxID=573 RepID=A0A2X1R589_KLEPN|nr:MULTISPECIES: DUF262 domain-containing protein [Klebsiella/Raoultella group]HBR1309799.1 DUF262 domain-containing protein [Klebsiella quasipneumoniae subsp. quasipneumoniae]HBT4804146.1 DUF262 domain-containing protein [Klebsiella quasipneumoniae subsp. similipneumoniae]EIV5256117.1 DUF262 domain-containing protein [Klebsiella pneumoniae]EIV7922194.1 DUF262 domain-containing protein [Klebsiella pneumoniae]EIV7927481.1 DUF262 domain-containing protein [Klebsiella pneumoniae]